MNKTIILSSVGVFILLAILFVLQTIKMPTDQIVYEEESATQVEEVNEEVDEEVSAEAVADNPSPSKPDVLVSALQANSWIWQETKMNDGTSIKPKQVGSFVLTFDKSGRLSGQTDCNSFGGNYLVLSGTIEMGPFMMTKMYCEGSQEMEFQNMLSLPLTLKFTEVGELVLMSKDGSGSVIFTPNL